MQCWAEPVPPTGRLTALNNLAAGSPFPDLGVGGDDVGDVMNVGSFAQPGERRRFWLATESWSEVVTPELGAAARLD